MIKAIIFDFDGTISNRKRNAYDFFKNYFREYFFDFTDIEYEAMLQDMMIDDCNGTIQVKHRIIPFIHKYKDYLPDDFDIVFPKDFYENMWKTTVLKPESISILERLRKNYKLALLSNGDSISQHNKIDHVGITEYFDEVMVSGDIGIHKPDKGIFDIMAKKLNVDNKDCLMVGDVFSTDILGADNAGMIPVWITLDSELPSDYYDGYRICKLEELFEILDKENNK